MAGGRARGLSLQTLSVCGVPEAGFMSTSADTAASSFSSRGNSACCIEENRDGCDVFLPHHNGGNGRSTSPKFVLSAIGALPRRRDSQQLFIVAFIAMLSERDWGVTAPRSPVAHIAGRCRGRLVCLHTVSERPRTILRHFSHSVIRAAAASKQRTFTAR